MSLRVLLLPTIIALVAILGALATPVTAQDDDPPDPGPSPGEIGEPAAPLDDKRVYDVANLLNNAQEAAIEMDASRLARHGVPNLVVVQLGAMTPDEASAFAADVRRQWGVETAPGADDGLLILVTVSDTEEGRGVATTMAWGDNALPHFGVTEAVSADIQQSWLDRYIDGGYLFEGILFTLRRLIYHSIYDPAPQEPLGDLRAGLGTVVSIAGTALAAAALALAGWRWARGWRRPGGDLATSMLAWGVPVAAVAVFALSVAGHSGWGIAAALVLLAVAAADWIARDPRQAPETRATP